ncbi:MAG TPA: 2-hydroxyhepta-2,4-diene-1,7-dioate isomerase, partial [Planctomycetota bacterium]|nr:2-hydroxyhepta-2,4-diene-1,7-dioate isomerase [Planctomycetota bacterium]
QSLVEWLWRDNSFPAGCFLSTGTGIVPGDTFTLQSGDEIRISIGPIGTLSNTVA